MSNTPQISSWRQRFFGVFKIFVQRAIGLFTSKKRKCSILDLPPELMNLILTHLSLVVKVCLAMSCRKFYHQFGYTLKAENFRYPYSDGLNTNVNIITRGDLLKRLQSPKSYFKSQRWRYCHAFIKLHPGRDFDDNDVENHLEPSRAQCGWPGVIMLCPCLKVSLKMLAGIYNDVQKTEYLKYLGNIPHWHECKFESPCQRLSYTLAISVSISETHELVFDFEYSVYLNRVTPYQGNRKLMLCPHKEALKIIMASRYRDHRLKHMQCDGCGIFPSTRVSDDQTHYGIQFARRYPAPDEKGYRGAEFADYNWNRRYEPHSENLPSKIPDLANG